MSGRYDNVCTLEKLRIYFPNSPWLNTTADTRDLETTKKVLRDACLVNKNDDRRLRQLCPDQVGDINEKVDKLLRDTQFIRNTFDKLNEGIPNITKEIKLRKFIDWYRANRTIKSKLGKVLGGTRLNWVEALPLVLMSMRQEKAKDTFLSPHEILTGRPMPGPKTDPAWVKLWEEREVELDHYMQMLGNMVALVSQQVANASKENPDTEGVPVKEGDEDSLELRHTESWLWRKRRSVGLLGPGGRNPDGVWIDAIGQARNIPDEFKLADEIAAGFESFPVFSAIFPITVNKNVNRINLIHYNVQRLANLTRDVVEAIHQQLSETSLMTLQNRIAIDMVLAEKGGVCAMFGDLCCTSISNNTGPDGSLTKGLTKLRALAKELKAQSGVSNPVLSWLQGVFGRWSTLLGQLLLGLFISVSIFITCGCCCIPCIRTLVTRTIEKAFADRDELPPKYQAVQAVEQDYLTLQETEKVAEIDLESEGECDGKEGL
ncbi:uncharacterized protein [Narcine bancroftii]|uniref:uncharacterized protein n=1 Tax=Narcine bancroftii TaxID=1343680 RepID=UPI003831D320